MPIITKSVLAANLGISKARVSQYCRDGMPVRPDGKLDRETALAWIVKWVASGYHEGKGADRLVETPEQVRAAMDPTPAPPDPAEQVELSEPGDSFTPEAHALLDVLHRDGPAILDRILIAYGAPPAERMKVFDAYAMTLGYIAEGLLGSADAWEAFDTTRPLQAAHPRIIQEVDAEIEQANATLYERAAAGDVKSPIPIALAAGRRARVA